VTRPLASGATYRPTDLRLPALDDDFAIGFDVTEWRGN
jgi:hypothetical protein